ncbi:hypothetical protein [Saccharothrix texasensis]|uniref:Uncharacterized protein n=1 Tax=Saccharothrix texasensis TaxID=103734 RepID=A0A3N1H4I5_9PSEU|nr:hypothetical protein [Saccharothrix texasensis]ROP37453.1 hypothetical protein EDD40_2766 [Saccharothrix texasensis]
MNTFSSTHIRPSGAPAHGTVPRPTPAGPEADERFRRHVQAVAGAASSVPLAATLGSLITRWFAPLHVTEDGALWGREHGQPVPVTPAAVRDLLRRSDLGGQLGTEPSAADLDEALVIAAGRARVEHERTVVAEQHQADRARADLVDDAERAERRAALLRQLAALDDRPQQVPAEPSAGWERLRRRG